MSTKSPETSGSRLPMIAKITRGHSCLLCSQRKIKCTGQKPCSACVKARVECVTKPTAPRQRRRVKVAIPNEDVLSRLRRCEEQLQMRGANHADGSGSESLERSRDEVEFKQNNLSSLESTPGTGMVVADRRRRYVNNYLWDGLINELERSEEVLHESSDEEESPRTPKDGPAHQAEHLLFGRPQSGTLCSSHPQPVQIFRLWQTFLDNVNPLAKLFHAPTIQQIILDASSNLDQVSTSTEALMFAIYLSAVVSLSDEECNSIIGESKTTLILRFSNASQQALVNAKVLRSSNMVVLQAFTLFLLAIRPNYDFHTFWALTGLATRCGERIGLHRESVNQSLSPFEGEMRRRLWWQIVITDGRAAQLAGAAVNALAYLSGDIKRPLRINDSDLNPAMKELPPEHIGATEMLFCSIRCEIGEYMCRTGSWKINGMRQQSTVSVPTSLAQKDEVITTFANKIEQNYLRYCDTSIPFHHFVTCVARTMICQAKLYAHHPRQYPDKGASLPQEEKDMLLKLATNVVEYHNIANTTKSLRGYLWHMKAHFPFEALIFILSDLCRRDHGELVIEAWQAVDRVYGYHPELTTNTRNALYLAIGNLAAKAWENCTSHEAIAAAVRQSSVYESIAKLFSTRKIKLKQTLTPQFRESNRTESSKNGPMEPSTEYLNQRDHGQTGNVFNGMDPNFSSEYSVLPDIDPIDWDYWQTLLDDQDLTMLDSEQSQAYFQ